MTRIEMKKKAKEVVKFQWGTLLVAVIILWIAMAVGNIIPVVGAIVLCGPFEVGLAGLFRKAGFMEKVECKEIFRPFSECLGESVLAGILKEIFIVLWTLLFIIPGIVKGYSYSMTFYLMMREPGLGGNDAITKSREYMKGNKGRLFGLDLSFLGWLILCILTCGILFIWVAPYWRAARNEFFAEVYEQKNSGSFVEAN